METTRPGRGAAAAGEIFVAVPVELKGLVEPIESLIRAVEDGRESARGGRAIDYAKLEEAIEEKTAEIERKAHGSILAALDVDAPRVRIGGKTFTRIGREPGTFKTRTGPEVVQRAVYRELGVRNGPVMDTISVRAGVYGRGWLPKAAEGVAHHVQQGPSREAASSAKQAGSLPYSRATLERTAHEVGEEWMHEQVDILDQIAEEFEVPAATRSISVALDRVSIPMEEPRKRPVGRPLKNAPKNPIERKFRMAYCGTVTLHDEHGEALHTSRFGCMPSSDPELLCAQMANEVYRLRGHNEDLIIKLLADGAPEMWNLLESSFPECVFGKVERGVDFWHVIEKLAPAASVIFGEDKAKAELGRWKGMLRRSGQAAIQILDQLYASGCENRWVNSKQPVHDAITYLENNGHRMNYAADIRRGLPIGSGHVEATCKTLVAVRMKRAGSRWKTDTGDRILQLRALALSHRWKPAMRKLHATRRRAVQVAA